MSRQLFKILENLPQNKLPTCLQVLQRYECMRTNYTEEISVSVDRLILEITDIWNKAYIPIMENRISNANYLSLKSP